MCSGERTGERDLRSRSGLLEVAVCANDQILGFSVCRTGRGGTFSQGGVLLPPPREVGLQVGRIAEGAKGTGPGLGRRWQTGGLPQQGRSLTGRGEPVTRSSSSSSSSSTVTLTESLPEWLAGRYPAEYRDSPASKTPWLPLPQSLTIISLSPSCSSSFSLLFSSLVPS